MSSSIDIITYMSGLTGFLFDKAVLQSVALQRGISEDTDVSTLTEQQTDLLRADLLYIAYISPTTTASANDTHGSYSKSFGSQTISTADKDRIYNILIGLYRKWDDDKLSEIESSEGTLNWL